MTSLTLIVHDLLEKKSNVVLTQNQRDCLNELMTNEPDLLDFCYYQINTYQGMRTTTYADVPAIVYIVMNELKENKMHNPHLTSAMKIVIQEFLKAKGLSVKTSEHTVKYCMKLTKIHMEEQIECNENNHHDDCMFCLF